MEIQGHGKSAVQPFSIVAGSAIISRTAKSGAAPQLQAGAEPWNIRSQVTGATHAPRNMDSDSTNCWQRLEDLKISYCTVLVAAGPGLTVLTYHVHSGHDKEQCGAAMLIGFYTPAKFQPSYAKATIRVTWKLARAGGRLG